MPCVPHYAEDFPSDCLSLLYDAIRGQGTATWSELFDAVHVSIGYLKSVVVGSSAPQFVSDGAVISDEAAAAHLQAMLGPTPASLSQEVARQLLAFLVSYLAERLFKH